jgi:hypothetical protein
MATREKIVLELVSFVDCNEDMGYTHNIFSINQ